MTELLGDQITDEGRDTNGDGQIDQIVVHVTIEAVKDVVDGARRAAQAFTDAFKKK